MRINRWGRAGHLAKRHRRKKFLAAMVLAGLLLCAVLPARAQKNSRLCFPLETTQWRISDAYGWRDDPFTDKPAFHKGIDLACAEGTSVLAAQQGVALRAGHSTSYGNYLQILHPDGSETLYAHLQYVYVRPGEVLCTGQLLGTAGQSGRATGAHLHFELKEQGQNCDPAKALGLTDETS